MGYQHLWCNSSAFDAGVVEEHHVVDMDFAGAENIGVYVADKDPIVVDSHIGGDYSVVEDFGRNSR